jgi:toxin ParE1/3/4
VIGLVEFIRNDQPVAARKLGRKILKAAERLTKHPSAGRHVPELQAQGISDYHELTVPPYRVIYAIRPHGVDIVAVIDGRRDLQAALFDRLMR